MINSTLEISSRLKTFKKIILLIGLICASGFAGTVKPAFAQDNPAYPVYIVQSGDTLASIADRFGISMQSIIDLNQILDPNSLYVGMEIKIPGFEGVQGVLQNAPVQFGESYNSIIMKYHLDTTLFQKLNRITSPGELFTGYYLTLPETDPNSLLAPIAKLENQATLLDVAIQAHTNPWRTAILNRTNNTYSQVPGKLIYETATNHTALNVLSPYIQSITIDPLPLVQGTTVVIKVLSTAPVTLEGQVGSHQIKFFEYNGEYVSLLGVDYAEATGLTSFHLSGVATDGNKFDIKQNILVFPGAYGEDVPINVDPATIDPAITEPEEELVVGITTPVTDIKKWGQYFAFPTDETCYGSGYGLKRIYNDTYNYHHTGLDFRVCADNLNAYAVAAGIVVYTGQLTVRGNAVFIDHGWGVYTSYYHLNEIWVSPGDEVYAGQQIGIIGNTGRSSGAHLHLDVWVNNIQVNPYTWFQRSFP